jgi:hypothetical protein
MKLLHILGIIIIGIVAIAALIINIVPFSGNSWPAGAQDGEKLQLAPLNPGFSSRLKQSPQSSYGYVPPTMDLSHLKNIPVQGSEQ